MKTDVRKNLRSLFRFFGLAAFILGPLWYLFKMVTRGLWISGMIGLTLGLVGYITLRLVDEEKGWKGAVLRAARWALGKIRTWPLWIQQGLLSMVLAVTMFFVGLISYRIFDIYLAAAVFSPVMIINILPLNNFNPSIFLLRLLFIGVPVGFWFLFGILLGKVNELFGGKYWAYIITWLVIFTILAFASKFSSYTDSLLNH